MYHTYQHLYDTLCTCIYISLQCVHITHSHYVATLERIHVHTYTHVVQTGTRRAHTLVATVTRRPDSHLVLDLSVLPCPRQDLDVPHLVLDCLWILQPLLVDVNSILLEPVAHKRCHVSNRQAKQVHGGQHGQKHSHQRPLRAQLVQPHELHRCHKENQHIPGQAHF